jgi:integrase
MAARNATPIRLRQRKTSVAVVVPVGATLKAALDAAKARAAQAGMPLSPTILATERGTAWTESGFRASWRKACIRSGVSGVTFHDLRGTRRNASGAGRGYGSRDRGDHRSQPEGSRDDP